MSIKEMETTIRDWRELRRMQEELVAEMSALEDVIKAELATQGTDDLTVGEYRIRWTTYTSNRIDTTRLKKLMPEVAEQFTKTTEARRFTVN